MRSGARHPQSSEHEVRGVSSPYTLSIYDDTDELAVSGAPATFLPYPDLKIIAGGEIWEVQAVQVLLADHRSIAAREGDPAHVEVIAKRSEGIHL